jgi:hypothetical protein
MLNLKFDKSRFQLLAPDEPFDELKLGDDSVVSEKQSRQCRHKMRLLDSVVRDAGRY